MKRLRFEGKVWFCPSWWPAEAGRAVVQPRAPWCWRESTSAALVQRLRARQRELVEQAAESPEPSAALSRRLSSRLDRAFQRLSAAAGKRLEAAGGTLPANLLDEPTWARYVARAAPLLEEAATDAAGRLLGDVASEVPSVRRAAAAHVANLEAMSTSFVEGVTREVTGLVDDVSAGLEVKVTGGKAVARIRTSVLSTDVAESIAGDSLYGAANAGALSSWKTVGNVEAIEWVTREDERVRASHAAAHGQQVGIGELFVLGSGALARYPGDPQLAATDRFGCRCQLRATEIETVPVEISEATRRTLGLSARQRLLDRSRHRAETRHVSEARRRRAAAARARMMARPHPTVAEPTAWFVPDELTRSPR